MKGRWWGESGVEESGVLAVLAVLAVLVVLYVCKSQHSRSALAS